MLKSSITSGMQREGNLEKWARNSWFLLHDNAPAHRLDKKNLAKHYVMALEHIPQTCSCPTFSF
jgi:hypothetical protein